jgi:16S rRNA (adenine1518-N6/adenine1519-N6)-dimethyltransferase
MAALCASTGGVPTCLSGTAESLSTSEAARAVPAHVARKRFGQHFLVDAAVVRAVVDAIEPAAGQPMVEIGPGLGALTLPLLQRGAALTVIELDRDLAARWRAHPGVEVVEGDVLDVDFVALAARARTPLRVVGNLPYNISSPILFHLFDAAEHIADQHFMLQHEVVQRIVAGPGGRDYGRLSVMLQWRYETERLLDVPAHAFEPPPKVRSAVVRMRPRPDAAAVDRRRLQAVVRQAFSQRRKLLRHALGRWLEAEGFGGRFDLQRRAEEVSVDEYVALARELG